jgi:outer membrane receptor protein involved in Fe transport
VGSGSKTNELLNLSGYAQVEKKFADRWTVALGGRFEHFDLNDGTETANKPIIRAGTSLRLHKATYLRASFGQGFRFPTITERYIKTGVGNFGVFPNPELKAETSWNAEFGVKQGLKFGGFLALVPRLLQDSSS